MMNLVLAKIDHADISKSLRILAYAMHRNSYLTDENLHYFNLIIRSVGLDDNHADVFSIDMRYELEIEDILSNIRHNGARAFLYLFTLTDKIFPDKKLNIFFKKNIAEHLPFDNAVQKEIVKDTIRFFELSKNIFENIFDIKKGLFNRPSEGKSISDYQKVFLVTQEHLENITNEEKIALIKILHYLMLSDGKIDEVESLFIQLWMNILDLDIDIDEVSSYNELSLNTVEIVNKSWLNKFLIMTYLMTQNYKDINSLDRLIKLKNLNNIADDEFKKFTELVTEYKHTKENLIQVIDSNIYAINDESASANAKLGLEITELALSLIPGVSTLNKARQFAGIAINERNRNFSSFGLVDISKKTDSDSIVICIDGFLSEASEDQFSDWESGLSSIMVNDWLKGFSWPSNNYKTIVSGGISSWYESVTNSEKASTMLMNDIDTIYSLKPDMKITLLGHSLGARVIYNTLLKLQQKGIKVHDVYFFGGAVSRGNKSGWLGALSAVENNVYNFYSKNDEILNKLYQITMIGDNPIGLGNIMHFKTIDSNVAKLTNFDVSNIINGHTEYKDNLPVLMELINK